MAIKRTENWPGEKIKDLVKWQNGEAGEWQFIHPLVSRKRRRTTSHAPLTQIHVLDSPRPAYSAQPSIHIHSLCGRCKKCIIYVQVPGRTALLWPVPKTRQFGIMTWSVSDA